MKLKLALLLGALIVSFAVGEVAARVALRSAPDSGFQDPAGWYSYHLNLTQWEGGNWLRNLMPHPYFGYVMTQQNTAANNYGFNDPEPFPYRRKSEKDFVIAVLGGSVALGWGGWIQNLGKDFFVTELKRRAPTLAGRNIVILDMAMGGYKQPQQLYIASYFLERVDLFLNLEGHNELGSYTNQPVFPIDYPIGAYLYFWQSRQSVEASRFLRFASSVNQLLISGGHGSPVLRNSALYFSLTKGVFRWATNSSIEVAERVKLAMEKELSAPGRSFYSEEEKAKNRIEAAVGVWERYVLQQQRLLNGTSAKTIFFLQPNQYMPGSKKFSEWEQKNAITSDFLRKAKEYELLPPAVKRMRAKGANIHDLTMVFSEEPDTVYADSCCHLNEKGNRIVSAEIARIIGQSMSFKPAR